MTDNEIVKALECCSSGNYGCENGCPLNKECNSPIIGGEIIMQNALDLINRLQAENDMLKALNGRLVVLGDRFRAELKTAKAEAYKEFSERVKKLPYYPSYTNLHKAVDNLLKEMVGEDE